MAIISYKEYKIENDENYFAKNNMLLEMAQLGDKPRVPINFDEDDLEFLVQFPTSYWGMALHERYDTFLRNALFERCKQRLAAEIAIFNEIEKITAEFVDKVEEKYKDKGGFESYKIYQDVATDRQKDDQKKHLAELSRIIEEIGINFESIKNLPETKSLAIKDEDLNLIGKETLTKWFNDVVAIKINKEEKLRPEQLNGIVQTFQAFEKKPNSANFKGMIEFSATKLGEVKNYQFPFSLSGMENQFINALNVPTPNNVYNQKLITNIKYLNNKNQIEIEYHPDMVGRKSINDTVAEVSYNYNSYDQEAVENFAKLETYNLIKKYIPFPVKTNEYDPDPPEKDVYKFKRQPSGEKFKKEESGKQTYGSIGAKSFIIRLIARLEHDKNEPHLEGSGLENSTGKYGYDLSGGYTKGIISCTDENGKYEFFNFTLPQQITFETAVREFLDANHHGVHGDAHEFKNYEDCLGKIKNNVFERPFDIVILAEYHIKHLNENKRDIENIEKFIKNEEDNVKEMKEELKEKYGRKRYFDAFLKIKKIIELYAKIVDPTKNNEERNGHKEEMKNMAASDKSIKDLFKFADPDLPVKHLPVKGLKNADLKGDHNYRQIVDSTTNACERALKKSISTGNEEEINVRYNDHGELVTERYIVYPMDQWEGLNIPSNNGEKNIFIKKEYDAMKNETPEDIKDKASIGLYLHRYVKNEPTGETDEFEISQSENEAQKSLATFTQFFRPYAKQMANNIVNKLIKDKKITVPFNRKHETIYHPAKSFITHPKHYGQKSNRNPSDSPESLISRGREGNKEVFYSEGVNAKASLSRIKQEQIEYSTIEGEILIETKVLNHIQKKDYKFKWNKNKIDISVIQDFIESISLIETEKNGTEVEVTYTPSGIKYAKIKKLNIRYDYNIEKEDEENKVFLGGNIVLPTQERQIDWKEKPSIIVSNHVALVHPSQPYARILPELTTEEEEKLTAKNSIETIEENKEASEDEDEEAKSLDNQVATNDIDKLVKDTVKGQDLEGATFDDGSEKHNLKIRGHHKDHKEIDTEEYILQQNKFGISAGALNLNKNNPKEETHMPKTPKYLEARRDIDEREDMKYEPTNGMKFLNKLINQGFKHDYVKIDDDAVTKDTIQSIKEGTHQIRWAIGNALGLVYNKWGKSKTGSLTKSGKKIIKCFQSFIQHCEDSINASLRDPRVCYKEDANDEEKNKKNKGKFVTWLTWKILSAIQKSEIKDCKTAWTRRTANDHAISIGQENTSEDGSGNIGDVRKEIAYGGKEEFKKETDIAQKTTKNRAINSEIYRDLVVDKFKKDMKAYINPKIQDSKEIYLIKKSKVIELMKEFKEIYNLNLDGIPPYLRNMIAEDSEIKKMIKKIFDESEEREEFIISILGEKPTGFEPTGNKPTKKTYTTATGIERDDDFGDDTEPTITTAPPPPAPAKLGSMKAYNAAKKAAQAAQQQKLN